MNPITEKTCGTCAVSLPVSVFRKVPTIFGGDGYSKDCKACGETRRQAKRAAKAAASEQSDAEIELTEPKLTSRPSLGFRAGFDSDGDFVITQKTEDLGEQNIWLTKAERAELARFLATLDVAEAGA